MDTTDKKSESCGVGDSLSIVEGISHLLSGFSATLNIIISFSGHLSFFSFQAELADPKDYPKALFSLQAIDISLYPIAAIVIYRYAGDGAQSPALLSTSPIVSKIAFGIAIGTIVIAGVIIAHVGAKTIYVRIFRGTDRMNQTSVISSGTWLLIVFVLWATAWVVANSIPVFNDLLNLLAAAFASWFSFGLERAFLAAHESWKVKLGAQDLSGEYKHLNGPFLLCGVWHGPLGYWGEHFNQCKICICSIFLCGQSMMGTMARFE